MSFIYELKPLSPELSIVQEKIQHIRNRWSVTPELQQGVKLPQHVFLIGDGDVRWANKNGLSSVFGHLCGAEVSRYVLKALRQWNIPVVTFWAFSTENWKRPPEEVKAVMKMMDIYFHHSGIIDDFRVDGVRMKHIGRKDRVNTYYPPLMKTILQIEEETAGNTRSVLLLGLDYGGRDEIVRATQQIGYKIQQGEISPDAVTEETIFAHLDTAGVPDPDFIIRTSGEKRLSGAMPFQSCYAEIYFEPTLLPDLSPEHLKSAIEDFSTRQRRFGGRPTNKESP